MRPAGKVLRRGFSVLTGEKVATPVIITSESPYFRGREEGSRGNFARALPEISRKVNKEKVVFFSSEKIVGGAEFKSDADKYFQDFFSIYNEIYQAIIANAEIYSGSTFSSDDKRENLRRAFPFADPKEVALYMTKKYYGEAVLTEVSGFFSYPASYAAKEYYSLISRAETYLHETHPLQEVTDELKLENIESKIVEKASRVALDYNDSLANRISGLACAFLSNSDALILVADRDLMRFIPLIANLMQPGVEGSLAEFKKNNRNLSLVIGEENLSDLAEIHNPNFEGGKILVARNEAVFPEESLQDDKARSVFGCIPSSLPRIDCSKKPTEIIQKIFSGMAVQLGRDDNNGRSQ